MPSDHDSDMALFAELSRRLRSIASEIRRLGDEDPTIGPAAAQRIESYAAAIDTDLSRAQRLAR